jgi:N-acetylglucosaminyl-diphospho-decaprenol L-rhamnosyltransferase
VPEVSTIVVTYNALPWLERSLESARETELVVVDHGSTDGTLELVRERFPEAIVVEQENKGFGAGNNAGMRVASGRWYLLLNSDAWLAPGGLDALVSFAEAHPRAAVIGPRLLNPDGTLQRSVRGFPTVWRIATEYLFLRKLAPRSRALNAFYAGGFDHDEPREAEFLMGSCLLVRAEAVAAVGGFDERYFMFSEETDWCYRFRKAGWEVWFYPGAEAVHVGGATTSQNWGPMFREQVSGHLRFLFEHRSERDAERARRLMLVALAVRGRLFRGRRGEAYRAAARWLASGPASVLLER